VDISRHGAKSALRNRVSLMETRAITSWDYRSCLLACLFPFVFAIHINVVSAAQTFESNERRGNRKKKEKEKKREREIRILVKNVLMPCYVRARALYGIQESGNASIHPQFAHTHTHTERGWKRLDNVDVPRYLAFE